MSAGPIEVLNPNWDAYQLIDSGHRQKLECFGDTLIVRSEPKAWWNPDLSASDWRKSQAEFKDSGNWQFRVKIKRSWLMTLFDRITVEVRLTDISKHLGIFPEQEPHWAYIRNRISGGSKSEPRLLNLFGYTGMASLVASAFGAHVTHVDASRPAIGWARENQRLSGLDTHPIRWILDDARKYVSREIRRKSFYDAVVLDPPSFGRGPKGEIWKVEDQIVDFLQDIKALLTDSPSFVLLTMYNLEASSLMLANLMEAVMGGGRVTFGELALPHKHSAKQLPLSLFARWEP